MKWVIKKGISGKLEVWEYIDTVEDASEYWYVKQAMRKYGVENVLPIAMNDYGGYHSLKHDIETGNIVKVVEQDNKPVLDLSDRYYVNDADFHCGWVSPDCNTYSCGYMEHLDLAEDICEFVYKRFGDNRCDDFLLEQGWIKVYTEGWTGDWERINDEQIRLMENKGIKHHVSPNMDYTQLVEFKNDWIKWKNREE